MNTAALSQSLRTDEPTPAIDPEDNRPLKVVIAYDDAVAGRRAIAVLLKLLSHSREPILLNPILWRFDLLAEAPWRDRSAADAADSDMIVLATSGDNALPDSINAWASACLARRNGASMAMLTLFGSQEAWSVWIQDESCVHTMRQSPSHPHAMPPEEALAACA